MKRSILVILTFIFSANASMAQKFIKFERKENVFTSKKPISSVYKNKTEINVILRNSAYDFTNNKGSNRYSSNLFFNIIEKEFIKYGINVKDAALYKLEDKTINNNVDLMIDLASVTKVDFNTNRFYTKKGEEKTTNDLNNVTFSGYSFDFRIVDAQNNEVLGFYTFNFTPCAEGCEVRIGKSGVEFVEKKYERLKGSYEMNTLEDEVFSDFFKEVANHLIKELKRNTTVASLVDETNIDFSRAKSNVDKYFPESHFFDNLKTGLIAKNKSIYIYTYGGENIESEISSVLSSNGYEITNDKHQAGYYLFVYKGKMLRTGPDPYCIQFQFIDAKTLEKLSGANYKFRKSELDLDGYIAMFVESL
jgi:hypothetical protein